MLRINRRCRRMPGISLLEMIMVTVILGYFITLSGDLMLTSFRSWNITEESSSSFRRGMKCIQSIGWELRQCNVLMLPNSAAFPTGAAYAPQEASYSNLAFRNCSPSLGEEIIVRYRLNEVTHILERLTWTAQHGAAQGLPVSVEELCAGVQKFQLTMISTQSSQMLIRIELVMLQTEAYPLSLEVGMMYQ